MQIKIVENKYTYVSAVSESVSVSARFWQNHTYLNNSYAYAWLMKKFYNIRENI